MGGGRKHTDQHNIAIKQHANELYPWGKQLWWHLRRRYFTDKIQCCYLLRCMRSKKKKHQCDSRVVDKLTIWCKVASPKITLDFTGETSHSARKKLRSEQRILSNNSDEVRSFASRNLDFNELILDKKDKRIDGYRYQSWRKNFCLPRYSGVNGRISDGCSS